MRPTANQKKTALYQPGTTHFFSEYMMPTSSCASSPSSFSVSGLPVMPRGVVPPRAVLKRSAVAQDLGQQDRPGDDEQERHERAQRRAIFLVFEVESDGHLDLVGHPGPREGGRAEADHEVREGHQHER